MRFKPRAANDLTIKPYPKTWLNLKYRIIEKQKTYIFEYWHLTCFSSEATHKLGLKLNLTLCFHCNGPLPSLNRH